MSGVTARATLPGRSWSCSGRSLSRWSPAYSSPGSPWREPPLLEQSKVMPQTPHANQPSCQAEFDDYAHDYDAGMGNPLKRIAGTSQDDFIRVKVDWLLRDLLLRPLPPSPDPTLPLLDHES